MVNKLVYDLAPPVLQLFGNDLHFLGLIGSYAVGEESIVNGKPISDIDYYAVMKRGVPEDKFTQAIIALKRKFNALNALPASVWVVPYDSFYGNKRVDTLTPYQLGETNTLITGDVSMLDTVRGRPIEYNSHIGLSGVAFMDACNRRYAKAIFNQIAVALISQNAFRTSYRDRIGQFVQMFPEQQLVYNELQRVLRNKRFPADTPPVDFDKFRFLFTMGMMDDIFGFGEDVKDFCDNIVADGDLHKFIRASYIAFYHGNYDLAEKYSRECCVQLRIPYVGDNVLQRLNNTWFKWLNGIGVYDEPMVSK